MRGRRVGDLLAAEVGRGRSMLSARCSRIGCGRGFGSRHGLRARMCVGGHHASARVATVARPRRGCGARRRPRRRRSPRRCCGLLGLVARRPCALPPANRPDSIVTSCMLPAARRGAQRLGAADHETAHQPGDDDAPRRPRLLPRRLELAPVGGDAALLRLERGFGLLHLGDELLEAHARLEVGCSESVGSAIWPCAGQGGVTSTPSPFLTGLPRCVCHASRGLRGFARSSGIGHEVGQLADAQPRQLPARGLQARVLEVVHRAPDAECGDQPGSAPRTRPATASTTSPAGRAATRWPSPSAAARPRHRTRSPRR